MLKGFCSAVVHYKDKTKPPKVLALNVPNLLTDAGKDAYHALLFTNVTASGYTHGWGYIASTGSAITPAVGNTSLTGEYSTLGLTRADAGTKTHTPGSNSTLIEHTFSITGNVTDVTASALFNTGPTGGTMSHIANFTTSSGALQNGDTLKISWTVNAS